MAKKVENAEKYTQFLIDNILYPTQRSYGGWLNYYSDSDVTDFPDRESKIEEENTELYVRYAGSTHDSAEYMGLVNGIYFCAKLTRKGNLYDVLVCEKIGASEIKATRIKVNMKYRTNIFNGNIRTDKPVIKINSIESTIISNLQTPERYESIVDNVKECSQLREKHKEYLEKLEEHRKAHKDDESDYDKKMRSEWFGNYRV